MSLGSTSRAARCASRAGGISSPPAGQTRPNLFWFKGSEAEELEKVVMIPDSLEAACFEVGFVVGVLTQDPEYPAPDRGEVCGAVIFTHPALVLVKDDVEHPVATVFDRPVSSHGVSNRFSFRGQTGDEVARLARHLSLRWAREDLPLGFHPADGG